MILFLQSRTIDVGDLAEIGFLVLFILLLLILIFTVFKGMDQ